MKEKVYRNYLLTILMIVLAFSYVDRMVFGVVLERIKTDLHLSDAQLGVLNGIGFAFFFSVMGIPIARWADRGDRIRILTLTTAVWSIAVALCGRAATLVQMLSMRICVAAGEAGCTPPASSLIPEHFSRGERPRAVARFYLGAPLGAAVGYFAGGWLNEFYGWRETFFIVGLPGLALALLTAMTLKEPRRAERAGRRKSLLVRSGRVAHLSLKEVAMILWRDMTFRHLQIFCLIWYVCAWGLTQWIPTFFIRDYHIATGQLGTYLAGIYAGTGLLGNWIGGEWGSRFAAGKERLQLAVCAVLFILEALFTGSALWTTSLHWAIGALVLGSFAEAIAVGPIFACIQTLVPAHLRATAQALVSLLPSFIGAGCGPLIVGALSDLFRGWAHEEALKYSLLVLCPGFCWAAWHLWAASRTVLHDLDAQPHHYLDVTGHTPEQIVADAEASRRCV